MDIYDKTKTKKLIDVDLSLGYLIDDEIEILIPKVVGQKEIYHYEIVKEFPNGGKEVKKIVDVPAIEGVEEHYESRQIKVYIPYTEQELEDIKERNYLLYIEKLIRDKYSINAEFAILRQRDIKPEEFAEYNAFVENCKTAAKIKYNKIY